MRVEAAVSRGEWGPGSIPNSVQLKPAHNAAASIRPRVHKTNGSQNDMQASLQRSTSFLVSLLLYVQRVTRVIYRVFIPN